MEGDIVHMHYYIVTNRCKIAIFATFLFLGDALGAIMQNVALMKRRLDAYKLSRSMYAFNYNGFRDIGGIVLATATLIGGNGIGQYYR